MVCADGAATVVSDVACIMGFLGGSEGASRAVDGHGVAPVGACSFTWAVDGCSKTFQAVGVGSGHDDTAVCSVFSWLIVGSWDISSGTVLEFGCLG